MAKAAKKTTKKLGKTPVLLSDEVLEKVREYKDRTGVQMKFFVEQAILEKLKRESK